MIVWINKNISQKIDHEAEKNCNSQMFSNQHGGYEKNHV